MCDAHQSPIVIVLLLTASQQPARTYDGADRGRTLIYIAGSLASRLESVRNPCLSSLSNAIIRLANLDRRLAEENLCLHAYAYMDVLFFLSPLVAPLSRD